MHLVLVPGLLIAMAATLAGTPAQPLLNPLPAGSLYSVAAQATTTATVTATLQAGGTATTVLTDIADITATATLTGSAQSTPVPLPQQGGNVPLQTNPFDPAHIFSAAPGDAPIGPYAGAFLALMIALLAVSGYFMFVKRPQWKGTNSVLYRAARRWGPVGLWIAIPGLLLLLFRVVNLDFFNLRFWLYLWTLVTLAAAGWFFYWYRTKYPKEVAKYQKTQRARQYIPGSASRSASRQAAQSKSRTVIAPAGKTEATTATTTSTSVPQAAQARPKHKSKKSGKRR